MRTDPSRNPTTPTSLTSPTRPHVKDLWVLPRYFKLTPHQLSRQPFKNVCSLTTRQRALLTTSNRPLPHQLAPCRTHKYSKLIWGFYINVSGYSGHLRLHDPGAAERLSFSRQPSHHPTTTNQPPFAPTYPQSMPGCSGSFLPWTDGRWPRSPSNAAHDPAPPASSHAATVLQSTAPARS